MLRAILTEGLILAGEKPLFDPPVFSHHSQQMPGSSHRGRSTGQARGTFSLRFSPCPGSRPRSRRRTWARPGGSAKALTSFSPCGYGAVCPVGYGPTGSRWPSGDRRSMPTSFCAGSRPDSPGCMNVYTMHGHGNWHSLFCTRALTQRAQIRVNSRFPAMVRSAAILAAGPPGRT